jgi:hypothetical protein
MKPIFRQSSFYYVQWQVIFYSCSAVKRVNFHSEVCYHASNKRENFLG